MKDYTKDIGFWKRLQSFVSDVQTNCCMGEEEKQMIIHNCKLKILDIQRVSNSLACPNCGAKLQLEVKEMTNSDILKALKANDR